MMDSLACTLSSFSDRAVKIARRIGPKRGITALAVLSAAVGASILVRRLRARSARRDQPIAEYGGARTKKQRRRMRAHLAQAQAAQAPQAGLEP